MMLLTACQSQARLAYIPATPADEPSKRLSSCGFSVGFSENSTAITSIAHSLLEQAATEARHRKTARIVVSAHYGRIEGGVFQKKRAESIADDLERLGFARAEISIAIPTDVPPTRPSGYVFVCDLADEKELQKTPPTDPDYKAPYKVGAVELRIPLRYLSPYDWRNVPFVAQDYGDMRLHFGWPGLQDRLSSIMQQCTLSNMSDCHNSVAVTISANGSRQSYFGLRQMPDRSELVPISGQLYGGRWFAYRNWRQRTQALLHPGEQGDSPSVVSCQWSAFNAPTPVGWQPTLGGVKALIDAPDSWCEMVFALNPTLNARVTFSARNIVDWRAIRSELRALIPQWQAPTVSNILNPTSPFKEALRSQYITRWPSL